ncbi:MAG TPA: hypothetical protein PKD85_02215 [Saprospiraceae bacterium]|nr:hypothetical protein [Saprospiraceae bacterium]
MKRSLLSISSDNFYSEEGLEPDITITDLIEKLKKIKNVHGDVPLCVANKYCLSTIQEKHMSLEVIKRSDYDIQINMNNPKYLSINLNLEK